MWSRLQREKKPEKNAAGKTNIVFFGTGLLLLLLLLLLLGGLWASGLFCRAPCTPPPKRRAALVPSFLVSGGKKKSSSAPFVAIPSLVSSPAKKQSLRRKRCVRFGKKCVDVLSTPFRACGAALVEVCAWLRKCFTSCTKSTSSKRNLLRRSNKKSLLCDKTKSSSWPEINTTLLGGGCAGVGLLMICLPYLWPGATCYSLLYDFENLWDGNVGFDPVSEASDEFEALDGMLASEKWPNRRKNPDQVMPCSDPRGAELVGAWRVRPPGTQRERYALAKKEVRREIGHLDKAGKGTTPVPVRDEFKDASAKLRDALVGGVASSFASGLLDHVARGGSSSVHLAGEINEVRLLHAADPVNVLPSILDKGFDSGFANDDTAWYGAGIYFSTDASYSDKFAKSTRGFDLALWLHRRLFPLDAEEAAGSSPPKSRDVFSKNPAGGAKRMGGEKKREKNGDCCCCGSGARISSCGNLVGTARRVFATSTSSLCGGGFSECGRFFSCLPRLLLRFCRAKLGEVFLPHEGNFLARYPTRIEDGTEDSSKTKGGQKEELRYMLVCKALVGHYEKVTEPVSREAGGRRAAGVALAGGNGVKEVRYHSRFAKPSKKVWEGLPKFETRPDGSRVQNRVLPAMYTFDEHIFFHGQKAIPEYVLAYRLLTEAPLKVPPPCEIEPVSSSGSFFGKDRREVKALQAILESGNPKGAMVGADGGTNGRKMKLQYAWRLKDSRAQQLYDGTVQKVEQEVRALEKHFGVKTPLLEEMGEFKTKTGASWKTRYVRKQLVKASEGLGRLPNRAKGTNEVRLLHGTRRENLRYILPKFSLSEKFAGKSAGTKFGQGIYMADDPRKSNHYAKSEAEAGGNPDPKAVANRQIVDSWLFGKRNRRASALQKSSSKAVKPKDLHFQLVMRAVMGHFQVDTEGDWDRLVPDEILGQKNAVRIQCTLSTRQYKGRWVQGVCCL